MSNMQQPKQMGRTVLIVCGVLSILLGVLVIVVSRVPAILEQAGFDVGGLSLGIAMAALGFTFFGLASTK